MSGDLDPGAPTDAEEGFSKAWPRGEQDRDTGAKIGGHGHVWPRDDNTTALCGGPAACERCATEWVGRYGAAYPHVAAAAPAEPLTSEQEAQMNPERQQQRGLAGGATIGRTPEPDDQPMPDEDRRGAAIHMALRHREQMGKEYLASHQRASVNALIEDARAIDAFLQGKDKP